MNEIVKDISTYAFRGGGKYVLIVGVALGFIADVAKLGSIEVAAVLAVFLLGYMSSVYFRVIHLSASGHYEAPEFPEFTNLLRDVIQPLWKVVIVMLISFSPVIFYELVVDGDRGVSSAGKIMGVFGLVYFPMAMLAVVVMGYLGAMNPLIVLPAIMKSGWLYWLALALLLSVAVLVVVILNATQEVLVVGTILTALLIMFTLMTNGRILGILYRERKVELGWV